jgi:ribonuclease HI
MDREVKLYTSLPTILINNLWWVRNTNIFKEKLVPPKVTAALTIGQTMEFLNKPKETVPHFSMLQKLDFGIPWGYFDGASQGHPPRCGVGVVLYIIHNHYIFIRYVLGQGSNNRAEFIALWTLLETTKEKNVSKLQVMGDSKLVIDWANGKIFVQDIRTQNILRDIKLACHSFEWISFLHILRELNIKSR